MAGQSDEEIDLALVQHPPSAMTPKSRLDKAGLKRKVTQIRKRGWELAIDDVVVGLSALAVPIHDPQGQQICVVSIAGLTPQMAKHGKPLFLDHLKAAARRIEQKISHP